MTGDPAAVNRIRAGWAAVMGSEQIEMAAKSDKKAEDAGQAEIQQKVDEANAQGFWGVETDKTPNENYTVAGQVAGKPTPETDAATAKKATE